MNLRLIKVARAHAEASGAPYCVVDIEEGEGRARVVVPESYLGSDEFAAFDGRVLAIVYPFGGVEFTDGGE
jgi:hypothetical protein